MQILQPLQALLVKHQGKLVGHSMSGCYVPCLPNPEVHSFLNLCGLIVIFQCACCIVLCCLLSIKLPTTSIKILLFIIINLINLLSIINHDLITFLMHSVVAGTSVHYHIFCMISPLIRIRLQSHTNSSLSPGMHFLHPRWHPSGLWSLCFGCPCPVQVWLLWLCPMKHFCHAISKVNDIIVIGTTIHMFVNTKG